MNGKQQKMEKQERIKQAQEKLTRRKHSPLNKTQSIEIIERLSNYKKYCEERGVPLKDKKIISQRYTFSPQINNEANELWLSKRKKDMPKTKKYVENNLPENYTFRPALCQKSLSIAENLVYILSV